MNKIKYIAFDADDTLWINETLFRINEQKFSELLSKYNKNHDFIERLYQKELENLRHFGYGIKGFVLSMIETAIELTDSEVSADDIKQILDWGKEQLNHPVELINGVKEVVNKLGEKYILLIITKGDLFDQESKIARSGLADYFTHIEIVSDKNDDVYSNILKKYNILKEEFLMVGNSMKSDILPIINIGAKAIHIPFETTWVHELVEDGLENNNYLELESISELEKILIK